MGKAKSTREVSDSSIAFVRRVVADLEMKQVSGTLTKSAYDSAVSATKKAVGKDWPEVSEAVENFKPKR